MKSYREVYSWRVRETVASGAKVFALDKKEQTVTDIGKLDYEHAAKILTDVCSEDEAERYYFWTEGTEDE